MATNVLVLNRYNILSYSYNVHKLTYFPTHAGFRIFPAIQRSCWKATLTHPAWNSLVETETQSTTSQLWGLLVSAKSCIKAGRLSNAIDVKIRRRLTRWKKSNTVAGFS